MENTKGFSINITPFEGDPMKLDFFVDQIESVIQLNKLSEAQALCLLKSKLAGAALNFYIESPMLRDVTDHMILINELKKFFAIKANPGLFSELSNLKMLQNESMQELEHRIRKITKEVYPDINDNNALQQMMFITLINAVPVAIKTKIIERKCTNFDDAIIVAKDLFNDFQRHNILNFLIEPARTCNQEHNSTKLFEINNISTHDKHDQQRNPRKREHSFQRQHKHKFNPRQQPFKSRVFGKIYTQNSKFDTRQNLKNQKIKCFYCGKLGHTTNNCRRKCLDEKRWKNKSPQCQSWCHNMHNCQSGLSQPHNTPSYHQINSISKHLCACSCDHIPSTSVTATQNGGSCSFGNHHPNMH